MVKQKKQEDDVAMFAKALMPKVLLTATPGFSSTQVNENPLHMAICNAGHMPASLNFLSQNPVPKATGTSKTASVPVKSPRVSALGTNQYETLKEETTMNDPDSEDDLSNVSYHADVDKSENEGDLDLSLRQNEASSTAQHFTEDSLEAANEKHQYSKLKLSFDRGSRGDHLSQSAGENSGDQATAETSETDRLKEANRRLQLKLRDVIKQMNEMQNQNENHVIALNEREYTIRTLNKTVEKLQSENNELIQNVSGMRKHVDSELKSQDTEKQNVQGLEFTIAKLNEQLRGYQEKYGSQVPKSDSKGLDLVKNKPKWIISSEHLSPLVAAYEESLQEKDAKIREYAKLFTELKSSVEELTEENRRLYMSTSQAVQDANWVRVQEQAKLVLEENQLLVEQLHVQNKRSSELNHVHKNEIARLSRNLVTAEADKNFYESELKSLSGKYSQSAQRFEAMGTNQVVTIDEHTKILNEAKAKANKELDEAKSQLEQLLFKIERVQTEYAKLLNERTATKGEIEALQNKVESVLKAQTKWQKKAVLLEKKLIQSQESEDILKEKLHVALEAAEKAVEERDIYVEEYQSEIDQKNRTINDLHDFQESHKESDENMRSYKVVMKEKLKRVAQAHLAAKKEYELREENFRNEIESLRKSLDVEQKRNDRLLSSVKLSKSPF